MEHTLSWNPDEMVVEDVGQPLPKPQGRIHMERVDALKIAEELVDRVVCSWFPRKDVAVYRGECVINGLFGVPKPSLTDKGFPVLRLRMNLVPANSILPQV